MAITSLDIKILDTIQQEFPVCPQPFKTLSTNLGLTEDEVLNQVLSLKEQGVIRRISALFNSSKLGMVTTLVAMKAPGDKIDSIANIINEYAGVTHHYERDDDYNLWFTLMAKSKEELTKFIDEIKEKTGVSSLLNLPTLRRFKVDTTFWIPGTPFKQNIEEIISQNLNATSLEKYIDETDKEVFKELQALSVVLHPYRLIADRLKITEDDLFERISAYKKSGIIRKIRAVLDHYKIGLAENVLVVFKVTRQDMPKIVDLLISYPQVTHCYERQTYPEQGWEYNLFAMIHGRTKQECEGIISSILEKTGLEYKKLYTKRELKKANPRYFEYISTGSRFPQ
ncbi:MAG: hypothetical protein QME42_04375 [bacterium]|nr:hypothetical protein [bacterium]